jgi:hypothetical protein
MRYGNHIEHMYKAVSTIDGVTYSVHRVTSMLFIFTIKLWNVHLICLDARQMNSYARTQIDNWSRITHSNVVRLHATLLTRSFNDSCRFLSFIGFIGIKEITIRF